MSFRHNLALNVAPIPLRIVLAATFLMAGLGKIVQQMPVQGEQAAILANLGVIKTKEPRPTIPPQSETITEPSGGASEESAADEPVSLSDVGWRIRTVQFETKTYRAGDFPEPIEVSRVNGLVLLMHASSFPSLGENGQTKPSIWPLWAGEGAWVVALAWAAAVTEVVGGGFLLFGLLSRFSALGLAGTMLVAIWLTELGPAIQSGDTLLGFLPNRSVFDIKAWQTLLWQCALLAMAASVFLTGPGALSVDRVLFEPRGRDEGEEEDDEDEDEDE